MLSLMIRLFSIDHIGSNVWRRRIFNVGRRFIAIAVVCYGAHFVSQCSDNEVRGTQGLSGKGGSLARFATTDTHLYAVDNSSLHVFRFEPDGATSFVNSFELGTGVETIATLGTELFIGTMQAMIIYDIGNPDYPQYLSEYSHFTGCDPVVVQDTLAFVTLRTTGCRPSTANTLDILNVKDPKQPSIVVSYGLESPYGLGIDGNLLFVCDGKHGLKVYDVSNLYYLQLLQKFDVEAFDVIPDDGLLVLTGREGVVQYDYSDKRNIREISRISIP
jgi:hypothetical protein